MTFTQQDLALIAEALDAQLKNGDYDSPSRESALEELANRVVNLQEAEQD